MKGIAIQTILLILVGIIVAGIVIYLVYTYSTGQALSSYDCRAQLISWCTTCRTLRWLGGSDLGSSLSTCTNSYFGSNWQSTDDCDEHNNAACTGSAGLRPCANYTICPAVGIT